MSYSPLPATWDKTGVHALATDLFRFPRRSYGNVPALSGNRKTFPNAQDIPAKRQLSIAEKRQLVSEENITFI